MLSALATLLGKIVDIVLKRADMRKDDIGPQKMYELYLALRDIIKNAKGIARELQDSIAENRHIPHIAMEIEQQRNAIEKFVNVLWELLFYVEIFDRDVHHELSRIAGIKFQALRMYYHLFCKLDKERLVIRSWDSFADSFERIDIYERIGFDERDQDSRIKAQVHDLSDKATLTMLHGQALQHIEVMQSTLDSLGGFIRSHCEFNDLFPKRMLRH